MADEEGEMEASQHLEREGCWVFRLVPVAERSGCGGGLLIWAEQIVSDVFDENSLPLLSISGILRIGGWSLRRAIMAQSMILSGRETSRQRYGHSPKPGRICCGQWNLTCRNGGHLFIQRDAKGKGHGNMENIRQYAFCG